MCPIVLATIVVATAVTSNGLLLNDNSVIEAYNANNLYRPYCNVSNNLNHLTKPAYVGNPNETSNFNECLDWAI